MNELQRLLAQEAAHIAAQRAWLARAPRAIGGYGGFAPGSHETYSLTATPSATANARTTTASPKQQLPSFRAYSIIASNPTGQWYYLPAANLYVPPYTTQMVLPVLSGTETAEAIAQTPGGFTSTPLTAESATFIFTSDLLPPQAGYAVSGFTAPFSTVWQGPLTNRSSTLAAGATSQSLMAANNARRYVAVFNPSTAALQGIAVAESIFVVPGVGPAVRDNTSIEIQSGGSYIQESNMISTQAWQVIATTIAHAFTAFEG